MPLRCLVATLAGTALAGGLAAAAVVGLGLYDVAGNVPHTQAVYSLLERTKVQSVRWRARAIDEPEPDPLAASRRGAACFRTHCEQCHGGPGVAPGAIGLSMQPLPGPLVDSAQAYRARELYWLTRNGIKMSGMPAWRHRLADEDLWAVVGFLEALPDLSPQRYAQLVQRAGDCPPLREARAAQPGDAGRGRIAMQEHGCTACHVIPGVAGSDVHVGPPLAGFARRTLIAGRVPNTDEQLQRWIVDPQAIEPGTAMPALGVGAQAARDMAAYLRTLD